MRFTLNSNALSVPKEEPRQKGGLLNRSPTPTPAKPPADKGLFKRFAGLRAVNFDTRLGPGPSRLYNVLDDYAGAAGTCFPHQATLAKRLGVSERSIRRWLCQLVQTGHVIPRRTGHGSDYTLAWVGLDGDRTNVSVLRSDTYVRSDRTSVAGAYKEEPYQRTKGPQSSSSSSEGAGNRGRKDDDDQKPPQERKTQNPTRPADSLVREVRQTLVTWARTNGYEEPSDPIPDEAIAHRLGEVHAELADLKSFLYGEFLERLKRLEDSPSTWKYVLRSVRSHFANFGKARTASDSDRDLDRAREEYIRGVKNARRSQ